MKSISNDIDEHEDFLNRAGIKGNKIPLYSDKARYAGAGFKLGYKGKLLLAYIGNEIEKDELRKRIGELDAQFVTYAATFTNMERLAHRVNFEPK